jgi:hypothetical protein
VLCQQTLHDGAGRLGRFDTFIKNDAAKNAEQQRGLLKASVQKISQADLSVVFDDALRTEIAAIDVALPEHIDAFNSTIAARQAAMLAAVDNGRWETLPALPADPRQRLPDEAVNSTRQLLIC